MKQAASPSEISQSKENLGPTLAKLMALRGYRSADLCRETKITKSIVSEVLSGSRTAGPRTMAQLLRAFPAQSERRTLLIAFLADSLIDVRRHLSPKENGALLDERSLSKIVSQSGVDEGKAMGPQWLDELIDEAVELGESKEHVLQLIREMFEDHISAKRTEKQSAKK